MVCCWAEPKAGHLVAHWVEWRASMSAALSALQMAGCWAEQRVNLRADLKVNQRAAMWAAQRVFQWADSWESR